jgi:flagellar basal body-associated protein FliL
MIRIILYALLTVFVLVLLGAGGLYLALGPSEIKADFAKLKQQYAKPPPPPPEDQITYYTMPELGAEIDPRGPRHCLVLFAANLRLHKASDQVYVLNAMPVIVDAFQVYFRDDDVGSATQIVDVPKLKRVMLERINAIISPGKVDDILFREMTIQ